MAAPAPGAVPWANVYSDVIKASAGTRYAYAGFWIRLVANIIDSLIISIPIGIIAYALLAPALTSGQDISTIDPTNLSALRLAGTAASVGYFVYFWTTGATPGMRLFGIRVADASTGHSIGFGKAFIRYIGYSISSFCCGIGLLWAAFDSRKQGWHDKMAGTVVLHR
jgi:uncharacterized RDD family membrane protein YckC